MHSDETIDVFSPFWAFPGAHGHLGSAVDTHNNDKPSKPDVSGAAVAEQTSSSSSSNNDKEMGAVEHRMENDIMDVGGGLSFGGLAGEVEQIADNVDGFLDDFLALGGGADGEIAEEDLCWLEEMDPTAFLPPPPLPPSSDDVAAGRDDRLPSPAHEIKLTVPLVAEGGEARWTPAAPAPVLAAAPVPAGGPAIAAVGVTPSSAGTPAASAPVGSDTNGVNGESVQEGFPVVGAAAAAAAASGAPFDSAGGAAAAAAAATVTQKEQLRRQKVERYLEKRKRRRWSKVSSYQSRQRVANARPRHKGRFLPLESEFVPIAELQRRQRNLVKEMRDKAAALARTADAGVVSPDFNQHVAV
ncbi:unnamed protein product [Hapterophycus canaliculatus]